MPSTNHPNLCSLQCNAISSLPPLPPFSDVILIKIMRDRPNQHMYTSIPATHARRKPNQRLNKTLDLKELAMCCGCNRLSQSHRENRFTKNAVAKEVWVSVLSKARDPLPNRKVTEVARKSKNPVRLPTTTSLQSLQHSCNEGESILIIRTICEKESSPPRSENPPKEKVP